MTAFTLATTSTSCALKLLYHLNQMRHQNLLGFLLNKQVNHTYSHYKVENPFDSCANHPKPGIHNMVYLTCIGHTWKHK
jgi:hypothetical protein